MRAGVRALSAARPVAAQMTLHFLNQTDPDAVCNDGSPAGYYIAPGSGSGANLWLVYLEARARMCSSARAPLAGCRSATAHTARAPLG
jgi:hypothetical protein